MNRPRLLGDGFAVHARGEVRQDQGGGLGLGGDAGGLDAGRMAALMGQLGAGNAAVQPCGMFGDVKTKSQRASIGARFTQP